MYVNQFSVRVVGGHEVAGGYVEIDHGQQYSLALHNHRGVACDAVVEIDGKPVGTFRLGGYGQVTLERPVNDEGRFTAYHVGTVDGAKVGLQAGAVGNGLIRVTFTPEKIPQPVHVPVEQFCYPLPTIQTQRGIPGVKGVTVTACMCAGREVGTGLSGHSGQEFQPVGPLDYDYAGQTVIHLRLVGRPCASSDPRPLSPFTSPVPPPVR